MSLFIQETKALDRFYIRKIFECILVNKIEGSNIQILDVMKSYENKHGFFDVTYLNEDDHHTKTSDKFINELKKLL